ncbi:hypothetical protein D9758_005561 [Tetrapyrgos nigripes]|uniref:BCAS3 WD40 domain-containing protein n=1 Tax=Tetrapyrgos nigripes TaxID=182062 RepID=A0A8H5LNY5_9AGAR|nr:hypothetical protein D9758_005561 [Tetrapyrgos nigripes]
MFSSSSNSISSVKGLRDVFTKLSSIPELPELPDISFSDLFVILPPETEPQPEPESTAAQRLPTPPPSPANFSRPRDRGQRHLGHNHSTKVVHCSPYSSSRTSTMASFVTCSPFSYPPTSIITNIPTPSSSCFSDRPSTNPNSSLNSTESSAVNSSVASPSSSMPTSPSLRPTTLGSDTLAPLHVSTSPDPSPGLLTAVPPGKVTKKRKKKQAKSQNSSSAASVSSSPPSSQTQAHTQVQLQPSSVGPGLGQPHVQQPQLLLQEDEDAPGPTSVMEEMADVKELSGLTGFGNLVDLGDSPGLDADADAAVGMPSQPVMDSVEENTIEDVPSIGLEMSGSGSGSGSRTVTNSMEGTIRPGKIKQGGHARASMSNAQFAELFEEGSSLASGQPQDLEQQFGEVEDEHASEQPSTLHGQASGLSQAIGKADRNDEDRGAPRPPSYPRQPQPPVIQAQKESEVPKSPKSLLSKPLSRAKSVQSHDRASGRVASVLSPPMVRNHGPSPEGRVQAPSHPTIGNSRQVLGNSIPAVANGGADEGDVVLWSRWDESLSGKRLLFLAYHPSGLQIWDCTDLSSIAEILNLPSLSFINSSLSGPLQGLDMSKMAFEYAGIIPRPTNYTASGKDEDPLESEDSGIEDDFGPLAGILVSPVDNGDQDDRVVVDHDAAGKSSALVLYSLMTHCVVKTVQLPGLAIGGGRFEVGRNVVVVSTTEPPALHILSSSTFEVLHRIPESSLSTFCHKPPLRSPSSSGPSHSLSPSSSSPSRRHSFMSSTSSLVNGIYHNHYEHFNDIYSNKHNHTSDRNVLLNTIDDSFPTSPGYPYNSHQHPAHQDNNSTHTRASTATIQDRTAIPNNPSMTIPDPVVLPAPVYSLSSRLLAYASPTPLSTDSNIASIHPLSANATRTRSSIALTYSSTLSDAAVSTASAFGSTLSAQLANLGGNGTGASPALGALSGIGQMSQADLGNAALKVGGSVLSGMKTLGGFAYKGAVAAAASGSNANSGSNSRGGMSALANKFFSKSAPAASQVADRRYSVSSTASGFEEVNSQESEVTQDDPEDRSSVLPKTIPSTENGYYVTVVDLSALFDSSSDETSNRKKPIVIAKFITSKIQPVANVWFSQDGTSVLVAPRDGQVAQAFAVRTNPVPRMIQDGPESRSSDDPRQRTASGRGLSSAPRSSKSKNSARSSAATDAPPLHVYDLRRGRTPAVIESAAWADDGRWVALGTRKRTVHVFPVNPYGGKSDVLSHMEGKVRNYLEPPPLSTELQPIVRLRVSKYPGPDQLPVPLAFTFLEPSPVSEHTMPTNLLPSFTSPALPPQQHSYGSVSSTHTMMSSSPSTRSEPISPHQGNVRPKNYQDILVFDPTDGILSLRRLTVDTKPASKENSSILNASFGSLGAVGSVGSVSRSLPGVGGTGRLSTSPVKNAASGISQMMEGPADIISKENTVATWSLRRRREWGEIRRVLEDSSVNTIEQSQRLEDTVKTMEPSKGGKVDWLAQAELSTCSKTQKVLPRSLYLSHQFSFHALGEDYHALIRRYHFDIPGPKIEVRKGIEVSAYPSGTSESFVEAGSFSSRRDVRRASASFDEPLASALSGGLDYASPQTVLPMLPNGMPRSKPRSFKTSIPIRRMGDNAAESLGKLRKEINRVRSPQLAPSDNSLAASVPLEFEEEDEDFLDRGHADSDAATASTSMKHAVSPPAPEEPSSTTPESNRLSPGEDTPNDDADDAFEGWVGQDQQAVDELEAFDHISAVGFLDEEQEMQAQAQAKVQIEAAVKPKKGKKGRRV